MTDMVSRNDRSVLRVLAARVAEISADPVQEELRTLWRKLNRLERTRPLVRLYDWTGWAENPVVRFDYRCEDENLRNIEHELRSRIYHWEQRRDDTVFEPVYHSELVFSRSGYGIEVHSERPAYKFGACSYLTNLTPADLPDIMNKPSLTVNWQETDRRYNLAADLFGDVIRVEKTGIRQTWSVPMDTFIGWLGIEQTFIDLVDRPDWIHKWLQAITDYDVAMAEQQETQNLLSLNNSDDPLMTGGLHYVDELPQPDFDGEHVRLIDMWGTASTQIFSEVSPAMHEEFALQYEKQFLSKCGLSYYGCCEPLHGKIDIILKHLPNVRKISMSPWVNVEAGAQALGKRAVFSYKPNPAILGVARWDVSVVEKQLRDVFEKTRDCIVEVTMKDLHDVHGEAHRMGEWVSMARRLAEEYA